MNGEHATSHAPTSTPTLPTDDGHRGSGAMLVTDVVADSVELHGVRTWRKPLRAGLKIGLLMVFLLSLAVMLWTPPTHAAGLIAFVIWLALTLLFVLQATFHWSVALGDRRFWDEVRRAIGKPSCTAQAARAAVLDAALAGQPSGRIDAGGFIKYTGPNGPRVLWIDQSPRPVSTPKDISEEVNLRRVGGVGSTGKPSNFILIIVGLALVGAASVSINNLMLRGPSSLGLGDLMFLAAAIAFLSKVRWPCRPITGSPGAVRIATLGQETVFSRHDSVLVIDGSGEWPTAVLSREDGASAIIGRYARGDPRLDLLLERWCAKPASEWHTDQMVTPVHGQTAPGET